MKAAFFGQRKFFDHFLIGGFQSYIRRLSLGLTRLGHEVDYILYDAPQERIVEAAPGLKMAYCRTFGQGLATLLKGSYDHVFRVWLSRRDRLKYLWVTRQAEGGTRWHHGYLAWPDSFLKRPLLALEGRLASPRGAAICVSPRQYLTIRKYHNHTCLVLPPVPEDYFLTPEKKNRNGRINITFLGNLTQDKYIGEIFALFEKLRGDPRLRFTICGTHDRSNPRSVKMHHRLQRQKGIPYVHVDVEGYSPAVDAMVKNVLHETDVLVQPYRTLQNTLATPLLLLEAMAALCAVITTPVGSVPDIYGESLFLLPRESFPEKAEKLLSSITQEHLLAERTRIFHRNQELQFQQGNILEKMLAVFARC